MDFSAILTIATAVAGLIWLLDALFFKARRLARHNLTKDSDKEQIYELEPKLVEYARSFFPILLIVLVLRSFIIEPFRIPSGSMKPSLQVGDFILVNKYTYGIRLPIIGKKVVNIGAPARGDVLVFRFPKQPNKDFIKRVIGLPGDKIRYEKKVLYVNGEPAKQTFLESVNEYDDFGRVQMLKHYTEYLPNKEHSIFVRPSFPGKQLSEDFTVPEGMFFVMGDNRDNSDDSREWGFVPEELILGKAFFIWFSWDAINKDVRWKRIGSSLN